MVMVKKKIFNLVPTKIAGEIKGGRMNSEGSIYPQDTFHIEPALTQWEMIKKSAVIFSHLFVT